MKTVDMIKVGFVMNIICMAVTIGATYSYGMILFDLEDFPAWAGNSTHAGTQVNMAAQWAHLKCY